MTSLSSTRASCAFELNRDRDREDRKARGRARAASSLQGAGDRGLQVFGLAYVLMQAREIMWPSMDELRPGEAWLLVVQFAEVDESHRTYIYLLSTSCLPTIRPAQIS